MHRKIVLEFTPGEAYVLHAFAHRFTDTDRLTIEDQAEERVLWDVCAMLEKELPGSTVSYEERLALARDNVRDSLE
jgi:hypothetical protein